MAEKTLPTTQLLLSLHHMGNRSEKSDYSFAAWRELESLLLAAKETKISSLSFGSIELPA